MIPAEVLFDEGLSHRDLRVYAAMVYFRDGDGGSTGERRLAGACRIDRRALKKVRETLVERGHIEVSTDGLERRKYKLLHECFKEKPKVAETTVPDAPQIKRELIRCPLCSTMCRKIPKVGWCQKCSRDKNIVKLAEGVAKRVVNEKLEKMA